VTFRRTPPRFLRRAVWALAVACAAGGPAAADDPAPSRPYPPTYSSRKAPWYDPFNLFSSSDKTPPSAAPPPAAAPQSQPVPRTVVTPAAGASAAPAWKWYGYGAPVPARNPVAPVGAYGAAPTGRPISSLPGLVPDPVPGPKLIYTGPASATGPTSFAAGDGPAVPSLLTPQAEKFADVDWSPAPSATLKLPTADQTAATADVSAPPARLKAPIRDDDAPPAGPALGPPVRPTEATPTAPPPESPDIPIEPAKGIILPPLPGPGSVSKADRPVTARGQAPDADLADVIRQACGSQPRVMEVSPVGPKRIVLRLAATRDAALAARDRLARVPDLAGYQIEFELVTPLRP
jgi:hypothetical protein